MFRSTKGASKQRRDLINSEISVLRDLLPLPDAARQRLSQLQIMSLACVYIRKCNFFTRLFGEGETSGDSSFEFPQTMVGFLMVTSRDGKLLYISDNVTEYLGHSMVDMMTQGDSVYDIIDKRDHHVVMGQLMSAPATTPQTPPGQLSEDKTFFCRMNVARSFRRQAGFGDHKMMHVRGRFMQPRVQDHYGNQPVFMAICSPLITPDVKETVVQNSTNSFYSVHSLDMKYTEIGHIGQHHLGYDEGELTGKSWYGLLHPEDLLEAKEKHIQLIKSSHEMGCMLTTRLQSKFGSWVWVNVVMHIRQPFVCDNGEPAIVCINQVIDDAEATQFKTQSQLYSSHIARSPEFLEPRPQSTSPPHAITQVPVEGSSYGSPGYQRQPQGEDLGYTINILAAGTSLGSLGQQPSPYDVPSVPHPGGSTSLYAESSSNSSLASQETLPGDFNRKNLIKENLKSKINTRNQKKDNVEQCRPIKKIKLGTTGGNSGPFTGSGTTSHHPAAPISLFNIFPEVSALSAGDIQVFAPAVHDGPVYQQLVLKKEGLIQQKVPATVLSPVHQTDYFTNPPTPLTPNSKDSSSTALTIDISETQNIPMSILTPEASPISTCHDEMFGSPMTNTDQALDNPTSPEMTNVSFYDTNQTKTQMPPKGMVVIKTEDPAPEGGLPVLDQLSLEKMLSEIETDDLPIIGQTLSTAASQQQQQTRQQQQLTVSSLGLPEQNAELLNQAVTTVLMDMVKEASQGSLDLSQLMTAAPGDVTEQVADSGAEQMDDPMVGLPSLSLMTAHGAVITGGDLFEELHQLTELELPAPPPYGGVDLPGSLFA